MPGWRYRPPHGRPVREWPREDEAGLFGLAIHHSKLVFVLAASRVGCGRQAAHGRASTSHPPVDQTLPIVHLSAQIGYQLRVDPCLCSSHQRPARVGQCVIGQLRQRAIHQRLAYRLESTAGFRRSRIPLQHPCVQSEGIHLRRGRQSSLRQCQVGRTQITPTIHLFGQRPGTLADLFEFRDDGRIRPAVDRPRSRSARRRWSNRGIGAALHGRPHDGFGGRRRHLWLRRALDGDRCHRLQSLRTTVSGDFRGIFEVTAG